MKIIYFLLAFTSLTISSKFKLCHYPKYDKLCFDSANCTFFREGPCFLHRISEQGELKWGKIFKMSDNWILFESYESRKCQVPEFSVEIPVNRCYNDFLGGEYRVFLTKANSPTPEINPFSLVIVVGFLLFYRFYVLR